MSVIDERGRVFGRVNLIDAIVAVVLLGLIPLAYGAFMLFRPPTPVIGAITPARVPSGTETVVEITGQNFRQFLEVWIGSQPSRGVFLKSPTLMEVRVPPLPAGTHTVSLLYAGRPVAAKPEGLIAAPAPASSGGPLIAFQAVGAFEGLNEAESRAIAVGSTFPIAAAPAEVLVVGSPQAATRRVKIDTNAFITVPAVGEWRLPAVIRLPCLLTGDECRIGNALVAQNATLVLPGPAGGADRRFVVEELRPADAPAPSLSPGAAIAAVRVRFFASAETLGAIKPGDMDIPGNGAVADGDRAVLTQLAPERQPTNAQVLFEGLLRRNLQVTQPMVMVTGIVRVPVTHTRLGWSYKDRIIKNGGTFHFETLAAGMTGLVLDVKIDGAR